MLLRAALVLVAVGLIGSSSGCTDVADPILGEGEGEGEDEDEDKGEGEGCSYIDDVWWLVGCGGTFDEVRQFSPVSPSSTDTCPRYYVLGDAQAETRDEAIAAKGCDGSCVRRLNTAASYVHCGVRAGFECFVDDNPDGCGQMCHFPEGYYPSYEDYVAAHPCPDDPPPGG